MLTVEENNRLVEWTRRRKSAQALTLRGTLHYTVRRIVQIVCLGYPPP